MKGLVVAKVVYYVLVFCWLLQITLQGYTRALIVPTVVLIVYGLVPVSYTHLTLPTTSRV